MKKVQKEIIIISLIFLFLSLAMHFNAWLDHPIEHIQQVSSGPLGVWHPFIGTIIIYLLVWVIRFFIKVWKKIII